MGPTALAWGVGQTLRNSEVGLEWRRSKMPILKGFRKFFHWSLGVTPLGHPNLSHNPISLELAATGGVAS